MGKAQLNACAFSDGVQKQKCCPGPDDIKTVITFLSLQFFNSKLVRMLVHFSHCWNRLNTFSKSKIRQSTLVSGCFFSLKQVEKLFDFDFHKLHNTTNVFVQNLGFYCARFSIQSLFKTTPCPLKRQRENHTGFLASDSNHEYAVDRRSIKALAISVMPFQNGVVFQTLIVAARSVVVKSVFNRSDL